MKFKNSLDFLLLRIKEVKERFGTLEDVSVLHRMEAEKINWLSIPGVTPEFITFFSDCVKNNLFDHVTTPDGRKYSNFPLFNVTGFGKVVAFFEVIRLYQQNQWNDIQAAIEIELTAMLIHELFNGKTPERQMSEFFEVNKDVNLFPKTEHELYAAAAYRSSSARLKRAQEVYTDIKDTFTMSTNQMQDIERLELILYGGNGKPEFRM